MSATSHKARRRPKSRPRALKLLALPPRPEMRRVTLYEVVFQGRSLHLGTEEQSARTFADTFNELRPDDHAVIVERPAIIAPVEQTGGAV
jgi:hypothetical protein